MKRFKFVFLLKIFLTSQSPNPEFPFLVENSFSNIFSVLTSLFEYVFSINSICLFLFDSFLISILIILSSHSFEASIALSNNILFLDNIAI